MVAGKIKLDNVILRLEDLESVTPASTKYEDWESHDGNLQILVGTEFKEVTFTTSVRKNREDVLKSLDGKTVIASADVFNTFRCVVKTQRYGVKGGTDRAIYQITLREDTNV